MDIAGFEKEMAKQKQRSKESAKTVDLEVGGVLAGLGSTLNATQFNGYTALENHGKVVALLREGKSVESVHSGTTDSYLDLCNGVIVLFTRLMIVKFQSSDIHLRERAPPACETVLQAIADLQSSRRCCLCRTSSSRVFYVLVSDAHSAQLWSEAQTFKQIPEGSTHSKAAWFSTEVTNTVHNS